MHKYYLEDNIKYCVQKLCLITYLYLFFILLSTQQPDRCNAMPDSQDHSIIYSFRRVTRCKCALFRPRSLNPKTSLLLFGNYFLIACLLCSHFLVLVRSFFLRCTLAFRAYFERSDAATGNRLWPIDSTCTLIFMPLAFHEIIRCKSQKKQHQILTNACDLALLLVKSRSIRYWNEGRCR